VRTDRPLVVGKKKRIGTFRTAARALPLPPVGSARSPPPGPTEAASSARDRVQVQRISSPRLGLGLATFRPLPAPRPPRRLALSRTSQKRGHFTRLRTAVAPVPSSSPLAGPEGDRRASSRTVLTGGAGAGARTHARFPSSTSPSQRKRRRPLL
jgi:hypothetical protein